MGRHSGSCSQGDTARVEMSMSYKVGGPGIDRGKMGKNQRGLVRDEA